MRKLLIAALLSLPASALADNADPAAFLTRVPGAPSGIGECTEARHAQMQTLEADLKQRMADVGREAAAKQPNLAQMTTNQGGAVSKQDMELFKALGEPPSPRDFVLPFQKIGDEYDEAIKKAEEDYRKGVDACPVKHTAEMSYPDPGCEKGQKDKRLSARRQAASTYVSKGNKLYEVALRTEKADIAKDMHISEAAAKATMPTLKQLEMARKVQAWSWVAESLGMSAELCNRIKGWDNNQ